jgi:hypothetical protein
VIVDASLLRKAPLANIARLARSLGVSVDGLDHAAAVDIVARAVRRDSAEAYRERKREERAQAREFDGTAQRQWDRLIADMLG